MVLGEAYSEEVAHASQSVIHTSFAWRIRPYKFVHRLQPKLNLMNIHNNAELLHSRLQKNEHSFRRGELLCLDGQEASEVLLESTQGRKALKSKVEVTMSSKHWPTGPTKVSSPSLSCS